MFRLGTANNTAVKGRPGLRQRITDLQAEMALLVSECDPLLGMNAKAIVARTNDMERRLTMLGHGLNLVRTEAKIIVVAESRHAAAAGTAVQA